ncbi:conserved hypothetical protein [Chloroherpeton thalassium ATCC 35110]|uniref:PorV/PorQ family protein n=1 Tax=Chloroherpeton thalassium (strain ATCC 35110 / GB-78) TaxID=517418 RepID=B3QYH1_CHLT3|nr:hypothetical protein [Chloroherpeton thalassium]ACF13599.1 conserved hypothetical protein [Chloroherpeton thalassium ATCC 35110]
MNLRLFLLSSLLSLLLFQDALQAQVAGSAAPYARMGFSSRGMALGNAGSAVVLDGEFHPYYNPAVLAFSEFYMAHASYAALSLDRKLNFVSVSGKVGPGAGLGFSWINSGVSDIDGRDSDGNATGNFSTSENLFMLSFANRFSPAFSVGVNLRGYLADFYDGVESSFAVGFDVGAIYRVRPDSLSSLAFAVAIQDVKSKYEWDTTPIYDLDGTNTTDDLPTTYKLGASFSRENLFGFKTVMIAAEIAIESMTFDGEETYTVMQNGQLVTVSEPVELNKSETHLNFGVMLQPVRVLKFRFGVDRLGLQGVDFSEIARPAAGFSVEYPVQNVLTLIDYAYVFEPYTSGMNVISVGARF